MPAETLEDLLHDCTVSIYGDGNFLGSGFFVAPGKVLTCDHVVESFHDNPDLLLVRHKGQDCAVNTLLAYHPDPYPDLALLDVICPEHECVVLEDKFELDDKLYSTGYTQDYKSGESGRFEIDGWRRISDNQRFLKFKSGRVTPGFSGSPLLDRSTGNVIGIVKYSDDIDYDLGGHAIPVKAVFTYLPNVGAENKKYHAGHLLWKQLRMRHLARLSRKPEIVTISSLSLKASLINTPDDLQPVGESTFINLQTFIGQKPLLERVENYLDRGLSVAVSGLPGIGKTALAAQVASHRLRTTGLPMLWLAARDSDLDVLIEALADGLDALSEVSGESDNKPLALRRVLEKQQLCLIVLDNAQLPQVITRIKGAIPSDIPLLVTSRRRIASLNKLEVVEELERGSALKLLATYAEDDSLTDNPEAGELVDLFGNHPLALEIAGKRLLIEELSPSELLESISQAPHTVDLPELGKPDVEDLFEANLRALPVENQEVLLAFGAFKIPGVSPELLASYLQKSLEQVRDILNDLTRRSLLKKWRGLRFYEQHDLIHSFAFSRLQQRKKELPSLDACILSYTTAYAQDYDLFGRDLPNLLASARNAAPENLVHVISLLVIGGYPVPSFKSYFNARGHTLTLLELLEHAITAARSLGNELLPTLHFLLGKRGDAHFDRGELSQAEVRYKEALQLAINPERKAMLASLTGKVLAFQKRQKEASLYFRRAYRIARTEKNADLCAFLLSQQSHAAGFNHDYSRAHRVASLAVKLNERLLKEHTENTSKEDYFHALLNLGSAELDLAKESKGSYEAALHTHQHARQVADDLDDELRKAEICAALGEDYHYLGKRVEAQEYLHNAIQLFHRLGRTHHKNICIHFLDENGYAPVELEIEGEKNE